jgi:hypothetical protein
MRSDFGAKLASDAQESVASSSAWRDGREERAARSALYIVVWEIVPW